MIGIDLSERAIAYAVKKRADLGIQHATFQIGRAPGALPAGPFDLVYAFDAIPLEKHLFEALSPRIVDGGLLVVTGPEAANQDAAIGVAASRNGFGFEFADVVGGWDGSGFSTRGVMVFVRGSRELVSKHWEARSQNDWPAFRDYANSGVVPEEKTQAFQRTRSRFGGNQT